MRRQEVRASVLPPPDPSPVPHRMLRFVRVNSTGASDAAFSQVTAQTPEHDVKQRIRMLNAGIIVQRAELLCPEQRCCALQIAEG